jgi:hypothetical protein
MGPTAFGTNASVAQRWTDPSAKMVQGLIALRGRYPDWPVCRNAAASDRVARSAQVDTSFTHEGWEANPVMSIAAEDSTNMHELESWLRKNKLRPVGGVQQSPRARAVKERFLRTLTPPLPRGPLRVAPNWIGLLRCATDSEWDVLWKACNTRRAR